MSAMRPPVHERAYRALLRLYPEPFRDRYGDEMVQLFADQLRDAREPGARGGTAGTWARAIADVAVTAASERMRTDRTVAHSLDAPPAWSRLFGSLGILGGIVLVAALIPSLPWSWAIFNLRLVLFEAGAIAVIVAMHARHAAAGSWVRTSLLTALVAILANGTHLVMSILFVTRPQPPAPDPEFRPAYAMAANAMWASNALFGVVALRAGVVSRLGASVLAAGSILAASGVSGNLSHEVATALEPLTIAGVVLVGVAWILLGIDVARRRRPAIAAVPSGPDVQAA